MSRFKKSVKPDVEVPEVVKPIQTSGKVTLDLTNEDIFLGHQRSPLNCPLARCGNRCIPGVYHVKVGYGTLYAFFGSNKPTKSWLIPDTIREYLLKYDETGVMVPFSWEIDLSSPLAS